MHTGNGCGAYVMPSFDEMLARNTVANIHETLRQCASMPCNVEYVPGIPPEVLPMSLAAVEQVKARDAECVIMITGTPGDGIWFKIHQRDGTTHRLGIELDCIEWWQDKAKSTPTPLFWRAA